MLKGLYASASGMLSGMNRQTVLSHNISNIETPGFKQVLLTMEDWKKTSVSSVVDPSTELPYVGSFYPAANSQTLNYLGELGLGVYNPASTTDFSQGALETTSEPLDMAIQGDGFFCVETPNGNRYTRDGRFQLDANGNLVTVDGYYVLDKSGSRISLTSSDVSVTTDGTLYVDGKAGAQLGVFSFADPNTDLTREENMFVAVGTPLTGDNKVYNNVLESSNVDMTQTASQMLTIARAYESSQKMVTQLDTVLSKTISSLGQFS
jgi:flagellar basal-body rod protein FlgF